MAKKGKETKPEEIFDDTSGIYQGQVDKLVPKPGKGKKKNKEK